MYFHVLFSLKYVPSLALNVQTKTMKNNFFTTHTIPRAIVPVYDGFDMLDVSGPFGFFHSAGFDPVLVGVEKRPYASTQGVAFIAQTSFEELIRMQEGPFLLWVPGGYGDDYVAQFYKGNPLFSWLAQFSKKATINCAVCVGAHIAASAGMLDGCQVTTHWAFKESLALFDLEIVPGYPRYHYDKAKNVMTGGGISSGLDEVLEVIARESNADTAMIAQLINQYAPDPPFNAGSPETAPQVVYDQTVKKLSGGITQLDEAIKAYLAS